MGNANLEYNVSQTGRRAKQIPPIGDTQAELVAQLGGTLTGTVDGDLADVADINLDTTDTYTDAAVNAAVNTAIAEVNEQVKELQTTINAIQASLVTAGHMKSS